LRCWLPFRVQPHAATSATLAGAYPFLAEAGLGSRGLLVGADLHSGAAFVYDPWQLYADGHLTNPNVVLAGVIGSGKSALAKALVTRACAFGIRGYVPADPKGEWTAVAAAVGGSTIAVGHGLPTRLNPLDAATRPADIDDRAWRALVRSRRRELLGVLTEQVLARPLLPVEHTAVDAALEAACQASAEPTLPAVVDHLLRPAPEVPEAAQLRADGRDPGHALRRLVHGDLAGLFDGPSTTAVDPAAPLVTLDLSRVTGNDVLLALVSTCASTWMEAALTAPGSGHRWVVYDEAWRTLRHPALIRRMQSQWKLSRAYGIANLMVIHRLSDLDAVGDQGSQSRALAAGLLADCSTRIVYRQETDQLATSAAALGLNDTERDLLPRLGVGQGLWRIRDHAHLVQHQLTAGEHAVFDTTTPMRGKGEKFP
jgi:type IV secretory pathway VirB4 component